MNLSDHVNLFDGLDEFGSKASKGAHTIDQMFDIGLMLNERKFSLNLIKYQIPINCVNKLRSNWVWVEMR